MTLRLTSLSVLLLALTACNKDPDLDEDGYPASVDCDDNDADEVCDAIDNNCDGEIDEGVTTTVYVDADGDGFGNPDYADQACEVASGYVTDGADCNDGSDAVYPGATEVCDGIDNDCNDLADDDDAGLDLSSATTWYDDDDQDGYGDPEASTQACVAPAGAVEDNTDCDDGAEFVNPGALEVCNGVDDNCDRNDDDGVATFFPSGGGAEDVTSVVTGSSGSAGVAEFSADGTLRFCDGTFHTALEITGDVAVESLNGSASTELDASGAGASVVAVVGDGLDVTVTGVVVTGGAGTPADALADELTGGGVHCAAAGDTRLALDDVAVLGNSATYAGGVFTYGCDVSASLVDVSANTASSSVGGVWLIDGAHTLTDSTVSLNEAGADSGGVLIQGFIGSVTADLDEVHVEDNWAGAHNAGLGAQNATVTWTGTASSSSGSTSNQLGGGDGGGLYLSLTTFTGTVLDFGEDTTDNSRADIFVADIGSDYMAGDDVSFSCDSDGCGTSVEHVVPDSSRSGDTDEFIKGNVFLAETDATIDSFAVHYFPESSCVIDFYVLEDTDVDDSWDVIWSSTGNTFSGDDWRDSGNVGVAVQDGHYYALVAGARCSTGGQETWYSFGNTYVASSLDGGFGTKAGYVNESSGQAAAVSGAVDLRTVAGDAVTYDMLINITEL